MADNVVADPGSGGATFATDEISSVHYPRTKLVIGADGVNDGDVSLSNPLPVTGTIAVTGVSTAAKQDTGNASLASIDGKITAVNTGAVVVSSSALPSGASTAARQDTGNTSLSSIDGKITAVNTGAVVVASSALPSGAATAAKQPALGTAGSASTDVITIQGIASGTVVPISVATIPSHAVTNAGTFAVQVDGAALTSLQLLDDAVFVDDAAFTPATSKILMVGYQADEASTDSVDEGDAGAPRMTLDRKAITTPQPHTAGGMSIGRDIDLDNGTLTVIKNAPGQVYGWDITNTGTVTVFVKFYDATSGTLGTGTPVMTIGIPGNASDDTLSSKSLGYGLLFATGICVGAGTGVADNDNTDPGANVVVANIYFK